MPTVAEDFVAALGKPTEKVTSGMQFKARSVQRLWDFLGVEAGWYKGRFLYLFGDKLAQFEPCLEAWSFLVPPNNGDRMIVGRNAYGSLLVVEDANKGGSEHVYVLDPFLVAYTTNENMTLAGLIGRLLPKGELGSFTDDSVYRDWVKANEVEPELEDILGFKTPRALGGTFDIHNIQLDGMIDYYRTTGPIYATALAKANP